MRFFFYILQTKELYLLVESDIFSEMLLSIQ
jgi:hypothetical protein